MRKTGVHHLDLVVSEHDRHRIGIHHVASEAPSRAVVEERLGGAQRTSQH